MIVTGDVEVEMLNASDTINMTAPTAVNIDTPLATFTGDVQVDGETALGAVVTSDGVDISKTHQHDDTGDYNISGTPVTGNSGIPE